MSNSNLKNFDNIHADLAQSAYTGRPNNFPKKNNTKIYKEYNFSEDTLYDEKITPGGKNLPNGGKVYLQPDPTLETIGTDFMYIDDDNEYVERAKVMMGFGAYQKGLLTDGRAGFNAYFLTDTPELGPETKQTYMAIRGSDGFNIDKIGEKGLTGLNLNDWIVNDAYFALTNSEIPQAPLAREAMKTKIQEMSEKAPNATMDFAAHSLGTMVTVQGLAGLSLEELDKVGKVVLIDGPDTAKSLQNMNISQEVKDKLSEKIEYYVNPFDMVSMLNREYTITTLPEDKNCRIRKEGGPIGHANIIVPFYYTPSFHGESAHDFGVLQPDGKGSFLVASEDFHPELLVAGERLARLEAKYLEKARRLGLSENAVIAMFQLEEGGIKGRIDGIKELYEEFIVEYNEIVQTAKKESLDWDRKMLPEYKRQLAESGGQSIELRTKILHTASQMAMLEIEEKESKLAKRLDEVEEKVKQIVDRTVSEARNIRIFLTEGEVNDLIAEIELNNIWSDDIKNSIISTTAAFKKDMEQTAMTLQNVSQRLEEVDNQEAEAFSGMLSFTKENWREQE